MQYYANSDRGLVRATNQDRYLVHPMTGSLLVAVLDGMGGHAGGDLAAECAAAALRDAFASPPATIDEARTVLTAAVREADRRILEIAGDDPFFLGMGTTVSLLLFLGGHVLSLSIGDSRTYLYRSGELFCMTKDDSYVQALVDAGMLDPADAPFHPRRNVITRSLGALGRAPIEISCTSVVRGDTYLLCTDGLYGMTGEAFLARSLSQQLAPSATVGYLIAAANEKGGEDNITAVLVRT